MFIDRNLKARLEKTKKSILLLGPRQTGKSTLLKNLKPDLILNLADEQTFLDFAKNPNELQERLGVKSVRKVFIDEVQRLPALLNTVQVILDNDKLMQFYLSGSSARKLRRGKANLLPGRINTYYLGPLCSSELDYKVQTGKGLSLGMLPEIYLDSSHEDAEKLLKSYALTYLKEEIQAESLTRNLEGFSRLLFVAAAYSGQFLDVNKLSRNAQIPRQSATRYFEILEDTLIVQRCEAFSKSTHKRLIQHPKFYFFDTGVLNALLGNFKASEDRKGLLFEHFIFNQILSSAQSWDRDIRISTYRTEHGAEVDFIVEIDQMLWSLELKASSHVGRDDLRGLKNFADFYKKKHQAMLIYTGDVEKKMEGVFVLPWQKALKEMGL